LLWIVVVVVVVVLVLVEKIMMLLLLLLLYVQTVLCKKIICTVVKYFVFDDTGKKYNLLLFFVQCHLYEAGYFNNYIMKITSQYLKI
jgi:hypothetical protein